MIKIFEYKIYPNTTQLQKLEYILEQAKFLYNSALEQRITEWRENQKSITYYHQAKFFKGKYEIPASLTQAVLRKLDITYKAFFRRRHGFPRFKPEQQYTCIELRQWKTDGYLTEDRKLRLWKMTIKLKGGRNIQGIPKQTRLIKRIDGWYWQIICELPDVKPKKKIKTAIGLDMGLKAFLADSDENQVKAPKFFRKSEKKLIKEQRILSCRKKGGYRRNQARQQVAKTHLKIKRQRLDWLHKLSKKYSDFDLIAVEKLNIQGMLRNHHLAKSIQDASWNLFLQLLRYKAESAGSHFIEVNPRYTSQFCSRCGAIVKKSLSQRTHICPECSLAMNRDINASKNILEQGRAYLSGSRNISFCDEPRISRL
ncbi:MAG: transposase [Candidatus Portnoybacteria bacterium]|nr:transposase [Candidatus Portnoybacteria bacterium]